MIKNFLQSHFDLPKSKQKEYNELKTAVINSGVQYAHHYDFYSEWKCKIDTDEKRSAIKFILGDLLEITDLDYNSSIVINKLGDIETLTELDYREFKLMQQIILSSKFRGRENHIKLANAMKAINDDGNFLLENEQQSKIFAQDWQNCGNSYKQFCEKNNVLQEDLNVDIEKKLQDEMKKNKKSK